MSAASAARPPRVVVFAPIPLLTITVESSPTGPGEVHLHAGGQGTWVARMARALGAEAVLCTTLGGESGRVLAPLIDDLDLVPRIVRARLASGVYVHDRRSGRRVPIIETAGGPLDRHEMDELYGASLAAALGAGALLLTGIRDPHAVDLSIYRRLARDVRANGGRVLADLSQPALGAALDGGVDVLKVSDDELCEDGGASAGEDELLAGAEALRDAGAAVVVVSRATAATLVAGPAGHSRVAGPRFDPIDPSGSGDSMFAALGVAAAGGRDVLDAVRLAVAAGALNVTRHGLGTGNRRDIDALARLVSAERIDDHAGRP
jgi:1-phosphofructokinase